MTRKNHYNYYKLIKNFVKYFYPINAMPNSEKIIYTFILAEFYDSVHSYGRFKMRYQDIGKKTGFAETSAVKAMRGLMSYPIPFIFLEKKEKRRTNIYRINEAIFTDWKKALDENFLNRGIK